MVEFVSYTGKYPNLCSGVLTVLIDKKEYRFGHDYSVWDSYKTDGNYDSFWRSGGRCGFSADWSDAYVDSAPWEIEESELPEEIRSFSKELIDCFNNNVSSGCCGGCL